MRGGIVAVVMAGAGLTATADTAAGPDFQRDIQPILAEHCGHCHGVDEATRAGGLRLDLRAAALAGGDSGGPAIVPGKPAESELVRRVRAADPDEVMPPPSEKKPLSQRQIDLLERWIAAGAGYEAHWAFVPPTAPPVPAGAPHPVDAFVLEQLSRAGLAPAPPAPEAALCRRLHLDLVGLPPSPEDLAAFARDGYEKTVERLLASPRYGEKWARQWLDLARYADSNGYEQDRPRQMWAWRDWVIGALNRDQPYDRFIVEQIAGDLLPGATQDQVIATGFLRNSMLNEEGAIIPEEFRMVEMFDRIDCVGKAVLGMSTQCAQCHTHKFDPLTQDEYYGMFAFLNNSYEARSPVHTPEQLGQIATVRRRLAEAEDTIRRQRPQWRADMEAWARGVAADLVAWTPLEAREMYSGGLLTHPVQLADKSILMLGHRDTKVFVEATGSLDGATGLQIEALNHGDLAMGGPARDEKWGLAELVVSVRPAEGGAWQRVKLADATADFSAAETREPAVDADGKPVKDTESVAGPVALLVDGSEHTSWVADRGDNRWNEPAVAVVRFEQPLEVKAGGQIKIQITMMGRRRYGADRRMIGCFRASVTNHPVPSAPPIDHAAILAIRTPAADRTERQERAIFAAWRRTVPEFSAVNAEIDALVASLPQAPTTVMHLAERPAADRRTTFLLDRGTWNKPLRPVEPHVPAALHAFPSGEPRNRLGFARWLVDRNSPLTARVAVNRIWQAVFGAGLVETPDDFGTRAPVPEHRGLLDWLAVDFMEHGWSQKHVLRRIVTSATYRQSSRATSDMLARDPRNVLLARGPRFRVDAEVVRDTALAIAGLLVERQGGPAVFPPVPENVLAFNFNKIDWAVPAAPAADRYRRSIYLFRRRSMPDPMLSTFDAPTGDISCARRPRSNTPLAALAGLNEPIFVEAARALARRALSEGGRDDASRVDHAFLLCTARRPRDEERNEMLGFLATQRRRLADGWLDVRTVATGAPEGTLDLPAGVTPQDAAAWTLAARVLLNLDETVTKN